MYRKLSLIDNVINNLPWSGAAQKARGGLCMTIYYKKCRAPKKVLFFLNPLFAFLPLSIHQVPTFLRSLVRTKLSFAQQIEEKLRDKTQIHGCTHTYTTQHNLTKAYTRSAPPYTYNAGGCVVQ
jgi:hypothetical protein